jgi:glutamate/tyrosine decarboxylase-like PLP-dependent enzyme
MQYLGNDGYLSIVREIYAAVDAFAAGIAAIPSLRILGKPDAYLVAFESSDAEVDILAVDAGMHERGWSGTQCVHP